MILICGTELNKEDLPFGDLVDYVLESGVAKTEIKLKTIAKGMNCVTVYLHSSFSDIVLDPSVAGKTKYFDNDDELIEYLDDVKVSDSEESIEEIETKEKYDNGIELGEEYESNNGLDVGEDVSNFEIVEQNEDELEEADTDIPDEVLSIPIMGDDINSLRVQLQQKDQIISQKDAIIQELHSEREDIYKLQETQLVEMKEIFEVKVNEANETIKDLKNRLNSSVTNVEDINFLKYAKYTKSSRAILRETLTVEETQALGKITSKVYVMAAGSGESIYSMLQNVDSLIDKNPNAVIVDFSGDMLIKNKRKLEGKSNSLMLSDETGVDKITKVIGNIRYISTTSYHDLALLMINWGEVLRKVMDYASGKPIILLFGSIGSFSVKYTVAKLSTLFECMIVTNCHPFSLSYLYSDFAYIQDNKPKIIVVNYFDEIKMVLEKFFEKYNSCKINAYAKGIDWKKEIGAWRNGLK